MTTTTVTPFVVGAATKVELSEGGTKKTLWRKEILPSGKRKYKGTELDFSDINPKCYDAFNKKAHGDQLAFVFADGDNRHNDDPERYRGEVVKLELSEGRLFGFFEFADAKTDEFVEKNPKFGVSSRIEVNYEREDVGEKFPYALSHVCGTLRPHIKEMSGWQRVELSEEEKNRETLDLSSEVVETEEKKDESVTVQISKEDLDALLALAKDMKEAEAAAAKLTEGNDGGGETVTLSAEAQQSIELAQTQAATAMSLAERAQIELAETRWSARRELLARDGVPPVILDLAEPVLKYPKRVTIELSDGNKVDASEVIEKMLDEYKGIVPINKEEGHSVGLTDSTRDKEYEEFEKSLMLGFSDE